MIILKKNLTASSIFMLPLLFLLLIFNVPVRSHEQGHITAEISNKGLDFLKDLLIQKAESSLLPLELSDVEKSVRIPLIGRVTMALSNTTIQAVHVTSSSVRTGDDDADNAIVLNISGSTADLATNWKYSYRNLFFVVSDKGNASIEVEGLDIHLIFSLRTEQGSLSLSLIGCECDVSDLSIELNGGASWLYQGLVDAFEGKIASAVEDAICKKLNSSMANLDSLVRSIPKEVHVTDVALLNTTFVDEPELSQSHINLEINGLFSGKEQVEFSRHDIRSLLASSSCKKDKTMVKILLHEDVFNSLSSVYFDAKKLNWTVRKLPNQSLLNTTEWKSIIPQLYNLYPDEDMKLNIIVTSPPTIQVEYQSINVTVPLDVTIYVLDDGAEATQVACFSTVIGVSVSAEISGNALSGSLRLTEFTLSLRQSEIGDLPNDAIQDIISTDLKTVIFPYANAKLSKGFKLAALHGYELEDAEILYMDSWIVICTDVVRSLEQFLAI